VIDHTETVVLPENVLTNGQRPPRSGARDERTDTDFDQTLVLEDELAKRRRLRDQKKLAR
jgi:hypothetical protein